MQVLRRSPDPVPAQVVGEHLRPIDRSPRECPHVLTIKVGAETSLRPQRVLEAARDFSYRRADVWPNVRARHLEVHQRGETFAEVTEGTWVVGLFWERNRYEWSQPGSVKATVIDSNIFQPGSTWELRATTCDGGSKVELVLHRAFRSGPKGRIASGVHHTVGKWVWSRFLRSALAAVEKQTCLAPSDARPKCRQKATHSTLAFAELLRSPATSGDKLPTI